MTAVEFQLIMTGALIVLVAIAVAGHRTAFIEEF